MFISTDVTEITGLTREESTTDGTGAWNVGVDLSSHIAVPASATGVCLLFTLPDGFGNGFWGVRQNGKTTPSDLFDPLNDFRYIVSAIPNGLVDIYIEPITKVFIVGFYDEDVSWFDPDAAPVLTGFGGGGPADYDLPAAVSASASGVITQKNLNDIGLAGSTTNDLPDDVLGATVVPVVSGQTRYRSYSDIPILAEVAAGKFDPGNFGEEIPVVSDNTWRSAAVTGAGNSGVILGYKASNAALGIGLRKTGDAQTDHQSPSAQTVRYLVCSSGVDSSGSVDYVIEDGDGSESLVFMGAMAVGVPGTQTLRKSSTFDIETGLSGTVTAATLNSVNVFDHITGQVGTTVSFEGAATDEITTSGEYTLTLGDGATTEDITVQVNVYGVVPSNNPLQKDGSALASLTGVQVRVTDGANINGTELYYSGTQTTDASGNLGNIDLSSTAAAVDDSVLLHMRTAAGDSIISDETVELI